MKKSLGQFEVKVAQLQGQLQAVRLANRCLRQKHKSVLASRNHQRWKVKSLRVAHKQANRELKVSKNKGSVVGNEIKRHRYSTALVSLCVSLFVYSGCSFRGVKRVLLCLELELGISLGGIPSKSSIENWVGKMGLFCYEKVVLPSDFGPYAIILDESMSFGSARMMVALGVKANKSKQGSLTMEEVWLLGFSVRTSWKWGEVKSFLEQAQERTGSKAAYVISDGGVNLKKAIRESAMTRICDVGHEICKFMEQSYKEDTRFKEWIEAVTKVRFQVYMMDVAYLIPPKQRTVARFTNLSRVATWAVKMLEAMPTLSLKEQGTFGWLKNHEGFIREFEATFQVNESILKILKNDGLSYRTVEQCTKICQNAHKRVPQKHREKIMAYLQEEKEKLPKEASPSWHASSDILESLFGKYKSNAPTNPMNGVTSRVLTMALMTNGNCLPGKAQEDTATALETISMANLARWKKEHLPENQLVKRKKIMKN